MPINWNWMREKKINEISKQSLNSNWKKRFRLLTHVYTRIRMSRWQYRHTCPWKWKWPESFFFIFFQFTIIKNNMIETVWLQNVNANAKKKWKFFLSNTSEVGQYNMYTRELFFLSVTSVYFFHSLSVKIIMVNLSSVYICH